MPNYVGVGYDGTGGNFVDIPVVDLGEGPGWPGLRHCILIQKSCRFPKAAIFYF